MKIALIPSAFHPSLGGVEELSRQLAHSLKRQGHDVIIITQRWPRDLPESEVFEGIQLYRLPFRAPEPNFKAKVRFTQTHAATNKKLQHILSKFGAEIVHLQCISTNGYYALNAAKKLNIPIIVTAQGELTMDASGIYETSKFIPNALLDCMEYASTISACSRDALRDVLDFYSKRRSSELSCPKETIHNGIALADFEGIEPHEAKQPYIFAMGRLVPQKGFDVLIEAFKLSGIADWQLIIAGDGEEKESLKRQVASLGLDERVTFWGRASRREVGALLKGSEFFVLPSRMEPQGIVNLEAMACGRAVLASDTGGVSEIVSDGSTGLLVPPGDSKLLSQGISKLVEDPDLRKKLGENGRKKAELYDWDAVTSKYVSVYKDALKTT